MAILEGGHIVPPRTQATSRSPAPLGLITKVIWELTLSPSNSVEWKQFLEEEKGI